MKNIHEENDISNDTEDSNINEINNDYLNYNKQTI